MTRKTVFRILLGGAAAIGVLGAVAPFLSVNIFRERIRASLEAALHRNVEIGSVHFNLFTGPGFSLDDVLIGDDPGAGVEPFVHVENLKARLRFSSLLAGRLEFAKLRLVEPSVNLVKTDAGPWNIQTFFNRGGPANAAGRSAGVPDIEISRGRINFKFGMAKAVFYISNADVTVYPNSAGDVVVDFSGEPARTDTGAQGFGRFSARGLLRRSEGRPDQLEMAFQLERSALSELVKLVNARDLGVHGFVASNLLLTGPLSNIAISGSLNVSDLHRWDLTPAQGETWTVNCSGALDLRSQNMELATEAPPEAKVPVALKFKATDFIAAPNVVASMTVADLPAASLAGTVRRMGVELPDNVAVEGRVNGAIGFSFAEGLRGELGVSRLSFQTPGEDAIHIESAKVLLSNHAVAVDSTEVALSDGHTAKIQARYEDTGDFSVRIDGRHLTAADLKSLPGRWIGAENIPIVPRLSDGAWDGVIQFEKTGEATPQWSGSFDVKNARLELPGIAVPLHIAAAQIDVTAGRVEIKNLRGRLGQTQFEANYSFELAGGPHTMRLTAAEVELGELERLFTPTLHRRQGILANLRLSRPPAPEWLRDRNLEASIQIRKLSRGDAGICAFKARLTWTADQASFSDVSCTQDDMSATGRIAVDLAGASPRYRLSGQVREMELRGGRMDFSGQLDSNGMGQDILYNATAKGNFAGRAIAFSSDVAFWEVSGIFELGSAGRLVLGKLEATDGIDVFTGQGSGSGDGHIVLDLTTANKRQVKLTGSLFPVRTGGTQ